MKKGENSNAVVKPQNTGTSIPVQKPTIKEVKLSFPNDTSIKVQAFHGDSLLYSGETKLEECGGRMRQCVVMPVDGKQWNGLGDNEKIIFKDGKGTVLGTATVQVLAKTSADWLDFDKRRPDYYYSIRSKPPYTGPFQPPFDLLVMGHKFLDSVTQIMVNGIQRETFDQELTTKFDNESALGILCCNANFEFEMNDNFGKFISNFCRELETGKKLEEAIETMKDSLKTQMRSITIELIIIKENIYQKIAKNECFGAKNEENIARFFEHANSALRLSLPAQLQQINNLMSAPENMPPTKKRIRRMIRRGFSRAMDEFQNSLDNARFRLRNDRKKCAFFLALSVVLLVGIVFTVANLAKISANASHRQLAFFILFFIIIVTYFIINTISFVLLCVKNPHFQQEQRPEQQLGQELGEIDN